MGSSQYLKHLMIHTPFERPALAVQEWVTVVKTWRHPELRPVFTENSAIRRIMAKLIKPHHNCIDAGCHLGVVLSSMRRLAPRGHHLAFEPVPQKAAWLRRKFAHLPVEIHEAALGEARGTAEFHHYPDDSGFDSLAARDGEPGIVFKVDVVVMDEVVGDRRIDFLKVDVEGAELSVFRGARRLMQKWRPPIVFECTRTGLDQFGAEAAAVYDLLTDAGYRIHAPHEWLEGRPALSRTEFSEAMVYPFRAFNFLAMPPERN